MRLLLALTAAVSLAACSHNKANVDTGPETGQVSTDTVRTTGTATGTATGTVDTTNTSADTVRPSTPDSL
jgi:hypothetical protein